MTEKCGKLAAALAAASVDVGYVQKGSRNTYGKYNYASDADVLHKVQPALAAHGLSICMESTELLEGLRDRTVSYTHLTLPTTPYV